MAKKKHRFSTLQQLEFYSALLALCGSFYLLHAFRTGVSHLNFSIMAFSWVDKTIYLFETQFLLFTFKKLTLWTINAKEAAVIYKRVCVTCDCAAY